ncbi:MAG: hypothetical protein ABIK93_04265 [candidate division WOR-3 bacterium]
MGKRANESTSRCMRIIDETITNSKPTFSEFSYNQEKLYAPKRPNYHLAIKIVAKMDLLGLKIWLEF